MPANTPPISSSSTAAVGTLKKSSYVLIDKRPGKIIKLSQDADKKTVVEAEDIFTQKSLTATWDISEKATVPDVKKDEYTVFEIESGQLELFDMRGNGASLMTPVPDGELTKKIEQRIKAEEQSAVTVLEAIGERHIVSAK